MSDKKDLLSLSKTEKEELIKRYTPKTKTKKTVMLAFIFGGLICAIGEFARQLLIGYGIEEKTAPVIVSLSFVFIASVLTALGLFSRLAKVEKPQHTRRM